MDDLMKGIYGNTGYPGNGSGGNKGKSGSVSTGNSSASSRLSSQVQEGTSRTQSVMRQGGTNLSCRLWQESKRQYDLLQKGVGVGYPGFHSGNARYPSGNPCAGSSHGSIQSQGVIPLSNLALAVFWAEP